MGRALEPEAAWSSEAADLCWRLGTTSTGLATTEALHRRALYGDNAIPTGPPRSLWRAIFDQFAHFMALLLWVAGALAFFARMPELGWAIWAVVAVNGAFGFWQEYRAERAIAAIVGILPARVRVFRDGVLQTLGAEALVPGDVVSLREGDRVAADMRITHARGILLDVSLLTGESAAVERTERIVASTSDTSITEIENIALAGTTVLAGKATGVVFATGNDTEIGKVAHLTASVRREPSALEIQVARVVRTVTVIAVTMGLAVFLLARMLVGLDPRASFLFAIGIVVANVPEGLLPTVTLALAMGVQRMAKRNVLVRRLSAIESLAATTVVCTDKTGTLTTNQMVVDGVWTFAGATSRGDFARTHLPSRGEAPDEHATRISREALAAAMLCSDAPLLDDRSNGASLAHGDPMELAIVHAAHVSNIDVRCLRHQNLRIREIPFDARRRRMVVLTRNSDEFTVFAKGSPAEILACSTHAREAHDRIHSLDDEARHRILSEVDALAARGHRLIAVASKSGTSELEAIDDANLERDLTFLGLIALIDPPRPEARAAVRACRDAGIRVVMITGDHEGTARAIGDAVGLVTDSSAVLTGAELDALSDELLDRELERDDRIFARVLPEQKLRIVEAYRRAGHVVAVTGDGVNDAPALRRAHVGIAMGRGGTDAARQAADIVLLDDNFSTIAIAVEEGRTIYANIRKFMTYILASNVPEIVPFVAMIVLRIPPALTILQILAIDLGTDLVPALALGAERSEKNVMRLRPRAMSRPLLDVRLLARSYLFLGIIEGVAGMAAYFFVMSRHGISLLELRSLAPAIVAGTAAPAMIEIHRHATTVTLLAIVACQVGNIWNCRSETSSVFGRIHTAHTRVALAIVVEIAIVACILVVPPIAEVFEVGAIDRVDIFWLAPWPVVIVALEELRKLVARGIGARRRHA